MLQTKVVPYEFSCNFYSKRFFDKSTLWGDFCQKLPKLEFARSNFSILPRLWSPNGARYEKTRRIKVVTHGPDYDFYYKLFLINQRIAKISGEN